VYVFLKGGGWASRTEAAKLTGSDSAGYLGDSVAISADGSTIVAGMINNSVNSAAYVFVKPGGGWATGTQTAKLTGSDVVTNDNFGFSVAINADGSTIVVGVEGKNSFRGAAYVFLRGGGWATRTEAAKLTASDGAANDGLGSSVAINANGSTIVAGADGATVGSTSGQGAVYVFLQGGGWATGTEIAKLTASDGTPSANLGAAVAISADGSTIVAGARGTTIAGKYQQGAVYRYVKPGGGWATGTETAELTASDGAGGDLLGYSVGINSDGLIIVAGARNATVVGHSFQGAAYVFGEVIVISGRVTAAGGQLLYEPGQVSVVGGAQTAPWDAQGYYTLTLPSGTYVISPTGSNLVSCVPATRTVAPPVTAG
jgi:hypothetical protein